jgi:hypothetical protein
VNAIPQYYQLYYANTTKLLFSETLYSYTVQIFNGTIP